MPTPKAPRRDPKSGRSVPRVVHQIFLKNQPADYRQGDVKLRVIGGIGVAVGVIGALIGRGVGSDVAAIAGMLFGAAIFGGALFAASRRYKRAYRSFIEQNMADDGTFLFCPNCHYDLRGQTQHKLCPECGTKPWVFKQD
ncbi:MAG: hypothetical protein AAF823_14710 [Planctomycetota bacterium]